MSTNRKNIMLIESFSLIHIIGIILGWVYWSMMDKASDNYSEATLNWALACAIIGIFIPAVSFVNIFLFYFATTDSSDSSSDNTSDPTSTMRKKVKFAPQDKKVNVLPMKLR